MCLYCWGKNLIFEKLKDLEKNGNNLNELFRDKDLYIEKVSIPPIFNLDEIAILTRNFKKANNGLNESIDSEDNEGMVSVVRNKIRRLSKDIQVKRVDPLFNFLLDLSENYNFLKNDYQFQETILFIEGISKDPVGTYNFLEHLILDSLYLVKLQLSLKNEEYCTGTFGPIYMIDDFKKTILPLKKGNEDLYTINFILIYSHNSILKSYLQSFNDTMINIFCENFTKKYLKWNKKLKPVDYIEGSQTFYLDNFDLLKNDLSKFLKEHKNEKVIILSRYDRDLEKIENFLRENKFPEFITLSAQE